MSNVLSPKDLALAIGVSESSMKRWADGGKLRATRTVGGHRRIPIGEAIRFVRDTRQPILRPEILGLPDLSAIQPDLANGHRPADLLYQYLEEGRSNEARGLIMALYMAGHSVAALTDEVVRSAMYRIGELWCQRDTGVYLEHRATDVCTEALALLRTRLVQSSSGPVAVGGSPPGDHGAIASLAAATVLTEEGFRVHNLGPHTPFESLIQAAAEHGARLVWVSISHATEPEMLKEGLARLAEWTGMRGVRLGIGGFEHGRVAVPTGAHVTCGDSMATLVRIAREILGRQDR
jgi:MerR family transcriptional regulator, light-induced transcriptional regulator